MQGEVVVEAGRMLKSISVAVCVVAREGQALCFESVIRYGTY